MRIHETGDRCRVDRECSGTRSPVFAAGCTSLRWVTQKSCAGDRRSLLAQDIRYGIHFPPEPFESIPLIYERAFGGWDRSNPDPESHTFEPRNPVGTGFHDKKGKFEEGTQLPNLEDPARSIVDYGDRPPPAGFGYIAPNWQPRASFAGTYDEKWMKERMPLLPEDFDRRFFNAASPGLIASDYLLGAEFVRIENVSKGGRIAFNLPGMQAPNCRVELKGAKDLRLEPRLDTVIINTDERLLFLIWRAHTVLKNGPHDVVTIKVDAEGIRNPPAVA